MKKGGNEQISGSKVGSIRVNTRSAIEKIHGNFLGIYDDDVLFQDTDHENVTCCYEVRLCTADR